jgi:hypothetical protein
MWRPVSQLNTTTPSGQETDLPQIALSYTGTAIAVWIQINWCTSKCICPSI